MDVVFLRKKRRGNAAGEGSGSWLNTYADMITLLLTFFVLLTSRSTINTEKWEELAEAAKNKDNEVAQDITKEETIEDVEVAQATDFDELYRHLRDYIRANNLTDSINVYRGSDYVFLRFKSNIFFGPDSAVLKEEARQILDKLCDAISGISEKIGMLQVTGHTADVVSNSKYPISDRALSSERANSVVEFIEGKDIIEPSKLISKGYGKYFPIGDNTTTEGQAQNRRVEIFISEMDTEQASVTKLYKEIAEKDASPNDSNKEGNDTQNSVESDELSAEEVESLEKA